MMSHTTSDNFQTRYNWHGETGPVLVLIHGLGLNRGMWQRQTPAFKKLYRVLTYDLVGHGETPPQPEAPDLTQFSNQLKSLLDENKIGKCSVFGFSLGGMIVRRFAMNHPEMLDAAGILFSPHERTTEAQQAILDRVVQARTEGPSATVEAALLRWFGDRFREENPDTMNLIREWVLANDPDVYPGNYQVLADGVQELISPQTPISCPALVMTGAHDFGNPPQMSKSIAAEIPNSELVILPELRHMAMMEEPDLFNREVLAFLERVYSNG